MKYNYYDYISKFRQEQEQRQQHAELREAFRQQIEDRKAMEQTLTEAKMILGLV